MPAIPELAEELGADDSVVRYAHRALFVSLDVQRIPGKDFCGQYNVVRCPFHLDDLCYLCDFL